MKRFFFRPSTPRNRNDFIGLITPGSRVLEIGPFNAPLLHGEGVHYADFLSYQELVDRAIKLNIDPAGIPHIDYVLNKQPLVEINENYDLVISCHCIEHQPNFIEHLLGVYKLLSKRRGRYFLIIPDKRFCFDRNFSKSTIAEIIDAYENKRVAHSLKSIIEHRSMITHNNSTKHWSESGVQLEPDILLDGINLALKEWRSAHGAYIDVHAWYFTPQSFVKIIELLCQLNYISFEIEEIYPTRKNSHEFWAVLKVS